MGLDLLESKVVLYCGTALTQTPDFEALVEEIQYELFFFVNGVKH